MRDNRSPQSCNQFAEFPRELVTDVSVRSVRKWSMMALRCAASGTPTSMKVPGTRDCGLAMNASRVASSHTMPERLSGSEKK